MSIIDQLNWRYAVKEFDASKSLSEAQMMVVKESLRLSASSFGLQPWTFVVIEDRKKREALVAHSWGQRQVVDASHLIVFCRPDTVTDSDVDRYCAYSEEVRGLSSGELEKFGDVIKGFLGRMDASAMAQWMEKQIYLALGNAMTVCAAEGIDSCPMEGFDSAKYDELLGFTQQGLSSVVLLPVGYRSGNDKYATTPKVRYPLNEVVLEQ